MNESGKNGCHEARPMPSEQQILEVLGENFEWIRQNLNRVLEEHPEYWGKIAIIASRCSEPVLAVDADHEIAYQKALNSTNLKQVAAAQDLPPDLLVATMSLADL